MPDNYSNASGAVTPSVSGRQGLNVAEILERLHVLEMGDTSLPKITIIGDKSSGKTSIFEALTGLSLPASTRPTNFAVHAQFKRIAGSRASTRAYILPGPLGCRDEAVAKHLSAFEVDDDQTLSSDGFAEILHKAAAHMDIHMADSDATDDSDGEQPDHHRQLSDSVLVIEVAGPDMNNLSVVDFPGFLHNSVLHDAREIQAVRDLVSTYIQDARSIILAVIDATNQIGNQEALELARAADPSGHRTIGVLTKCDAIQPGEEKKVVRVARNKVHRLAQGWFAVRNASPQERRDGLLSDPEVRDATEAAFFASRGDAWAKLSRGRTGLAALRGFLRDTVDALLQESIDRLMREIQRLSLGPAPSTVGIANSVDIADEKHHLHAVSEVASGAGLVSASASSGELGLAKETEGDDDVEAGPGRKRPTVLINACTVALCLILVMTLVGFSCKQLAQEIATDGNWFRLLLLVTAPLQVFVSLFFCQSLINTVAQLIGPVSQMNNNSKFFSAKAGKRLHIRDGPLPHVTIQCPVYKEGLEGVIEPTVQSLEAAIRDYASHGGTANIFMNDDGMQLLSEEEAIERRAYYVAHNIGWVARPKHNPSGEGLQRFIRRGKFKKASNMNYALGISLKVEDKLVEVNRDGPGIWTQTEEEAAYARCLAEVLSEEEGRAWAEGDIRVGDYILIIDSDTRVPVSCLIDGVSEMEESPQVAIIQFSSGVMNVTTSYFERGITFFTQLIYTAIRYAVSNGDVSPFVGHNALLRWSALQEVSFQTDDHAPSDLAPGEPDPNSTTPYEKFWSESHVSEDFDISLRLQTMGYHIRLGAYCGEDFKEGVSLTVYDELARWEKYAYGCSELLFHPVRLWPTRGPITPLFRKFVFSSMPIGSKVTIMAYVGTYYAIGYAWIGALLNYFLIGWANGHLDHYYMNSWRVWVALFVVFSLAGNVALAVVRYRSENTSLIKQIWICFRWAPLLFVFLGGISMHVCQAILCHMLSIDMSWGATAKEVEDTSFFIEMPMIARRFKFSFVYCIGTVALIVCGLYVFPFLWRIDELIAIFPLGCVIFSHFFLPVLLNPALMKFTW